MKRILAAFLLLLCLAGCTPQPKSYTADFFAMDTFMSVSYTHLDVYKRQI